jgi:sterol desaturase/sphingolipid hydroxylase (fatty acid hydroxylase superfamily)
LPLWALFSDAIFYFLHRLLHSKALRHIHNLHNNNIVSSRMDAFDMHCLEAFLLFFVVFSAPVFMLRPPFWLLQIILLFDGISSLQAHNPETFHAVHHVTPHVNYGFEYGIFDRLLQTRRY